MDTIATAGLDIAKNSFAAGLGASFETAPRRVASFDPQDEGHGLSST